MIEFKYRCSEASGRPLDGETPVDYVRRMQYEISRLESVLERHIMWWTHKNLNAAECPICAIFVVSNGLARDYERMLGGDAEQREVDAEDIEQRRIEGREDLNG